MYYSIYWYFFRIALQMVTLHRHTGKNVSTFHNMVFSLLFFHLHVQATCLHLDSFHVPGAHNGRHFHILTNTKQWCLLSQSYFGRGSSLSFHVISCFLLKSICHFSSLVKFNVTNKSMLALFIKIHL